MPGEENQYLLIIVYYEHVWYITNIQIQNDTNWSIAYSQSNPQVNSRRGRGN